jgi:ribosomal protein S18 acetylase RimI-like enzyme
MTVSARAAERPDLVHLVEMYAGLADEQRAIREIWPYTDGLSQPVDGTLDTLLDAGESIVIVGEIDGAVLGMLVTTVEPLLAPMADRSIGVIRLIYVDPAARGVGVGGAMLARALEDFERSGIDLFDAPVSPGHRLAKNFFESHGFKARSIIMHREGIPAAISLGEEP